MKESKIRMRSWKTVGMIMAYVTLLALGVIIMLNSFLYNNNYELGESYRSVYITLTVIQVLMISFIVPILTSGAISLEREKQTLDILLSTNLRPISIVMGKLTTSISMVLLLIIASLPVFSFVLLFGGLDLLSILNMVLFYIVISFFFGSIGIFFSTLFKKTITSIVLTYLVMIFLTIGTFVITFIYIETKQKYMLYDNNTFWLLYINPGLTFWSILIKQFGDIQNIYDIIGNNKYFWIISTSLFSIFSACLIFASAYILNPIRKVTKKTKNLRTNMS
jgi:ABC-type transport system involved in multi-copper enzyme maturation permease subunit